MPGSFARHTPFARQTIAEALTRIPGLGIPPYTTNRRPRLPYKGSSRPGERLSPLGSYRGDTARENGLTFRVDWLKGQKTGSSSTSATTARSCSVSPKADVCSTCSATPAVFRSTPSPAAPKGGERRLVGQGHLLTDANVELNFPGLHAPQLGGRGRLLVISDTMESGAYDLPYFSTPPAFAKPTGVHCATPPFKATGAHQCPRFREDSPGGILFTLLVLAGRNKANSSAWRCSAPQRRAVARCAYSISSRSPPTIR